MFILLIIALIALIAGLFLVFAELSLGFTLNGDYKRFNDYLTKIAKKELIYLVYHDSLKELNDKNYVHDDALGVYIYPKTYMTPIELAVGKLPRIELSREHMFKSRKKSLLSLMTFAHEIGHHFSLKDKKDDSERAADMYAIKLLKEFFPKWKQIFYFPLIMLYLQKY